MATIEEIFRNAFGEIHPNIDVNIFLKEYDYYKQRKPLLHKTFTELHQYVHDELPNVDAILSARLKSKFSFLRKKYIKLAMNIETLFAHDKSNAKEQKKAIDTYLSFLPEKKFESIKKIIASFNSSQVNSLTGFSFVFNQLTDKEKQILISNLSKTEDTFGYSFTVKNVSFPIHRIITLEDGSIGMVEPTDSLKTTPKVHPIHTTVKFNPETDIIQKTPHIKYISIDSEEYPLNEEYLLYPSSLPTAERTLQNALRDENGKVTLLQDTIAFQGKTSFPIDSIVYDKTMNSYFLATPQGERINLSRKLQVKDILLKKYDEESCETAIKDIRLTIAQFYKSHGFSSLLGRRKNYIKAPKINERKQAYYRAFHDSAENTRFRYKIEGQLRTFFNHILYRQDHDGYKADTIQNLKRNSILSKIYEKYPMILDASTPTLMKLLENNPDMDIGNLMPTYFATTTFPNGQSTTIELPEEMAFMHVFGRYANFKRPSSDTVTLDFSSYDNFIDSRTSQDPMDGLEI